MKNNRTMWIVIAVVVVVLIAWAVMKGKHEHPGTPMKSEQQQEQPAGGTSEHPKN